LFNLGLDTSSLAKLLVEIKIVPIFRDTNISLKLAKDLIRRRFLIEKIRRENMNTRKQREMLTVDVKPMGAAESLHISCKKDKDCRKRTKDSIKQALIKCRKEGPFCPVERIEEMKFYISEYE